MTARELTNRLADLLRREQHAMADFLVALADFDRGACGPTSATPGSSCFCIASSVCRRALPTTARRRKRVFVTTVSLALPAAATVHPAGQVEPVQLANLPDANSQSADRVTLSRSNERSDVAVPLTAELRRLHVTVSRRFMQKLEAARDALSHKLPGAELEEILEAGLDLLVAQHAKRKGLVAKPRKEPPPSNPDSEHIPAHVRRAVWLRDGGRCQYPLDGGGICGSTHQVEFDHVRPRALGGPSTVENIRCACRPHNGLAARQVFGKGWMDQFTGGGRRREAAPPSR